MLNRYVLRLLFLAIVIVTVFHFLLSQYSDQSLTEISRVSSVYNSVSSKFQGPELKKAILSSASSPLNPELVELAFEQPFIQGKSNATFLTLARNSELEKLLPSIRSVEDRFNKKFHYDWVFLNEEEFSEEFVEAVSTLVSGKARFGIIPKEHWGYPEWIDQEKAAESRKKLAEANVNYGGLESYRHMCRFQSGFFFHHPIMQEYRWYWRVEPETSLRCDINYDVFQYMQTHNKKYGFTISITEFESTIPTLWNTTKEFVKENPTLVAKDNLLKFVSNDDGDSYNLCHFWSNFEIADADFWRGEAYTKYFEYLDRKGGFFYERWGDAPVHSIGASLFLPKDQIHFFNDIGYTHPPFSHCPTNAKTLKELKCDCIAKQSFDWVSSSCLNKFYQARDIPLPDDWKSHQYW